MPDSYDYSNRKIKFVHGKYICEKKSEKKQEQKEQFCLKI